MSDLFDSLDSSDLDEIAGKLNVSQSQKRHEEKKEKDVT